MGQLPLGDVKVPRRFEQVRPVRLSLDTVSVWMPHAVPCSNGLVSVCHVHSSKNHSVYSRMHACIPFAQRVRVRLLRHILRR